MSKFRFKGILFGILFVACLEQTNAQIYHSASQAFQASREKHLPILLIFSGSDWCVPCIKFEKAILNDTAFQRFAKKQLIVLEADFPQRKKQPADIISQNESLASRYNPGGAFPKMLLLKTDQTVLREVEYNNQRPSTFITEISNYLHTADMLKEYSLRTRLMGSAFEFIVTSDNQSMAGQQLALCVEETKRLETLLTEFNESSQTSLINKNAGIAPVQVDKEVYDLIERSNRISKMSGGAFDISAGALKNLYNFKGQEFNFPTNDQIKNVLEKTGYDKIKLIEPDNIFLKKPEMRISFAAIGKGYAADQVKRLLIQNGVKSGVINASGDLTAWGTKSNGEPWVTGIANPDNIDQIILWLPIDGLSVATSGNYIQYFEKNGRRYSHNIDPRNGKPVEGIKSVTTLSPAAELSDALATAVTAMGVKNGLLLIDQLPLTHCIIIDEFNKIHISKNLAVQANA